MKVAMYAGTYLKEQDGVAKTLYEFVDTLLSHDIEVAIWSPTITPQEKDGLTLNKIPSIPLIVYPVYRISLWTPGIRKAIDNFKPDIIHTSTPDLLGLKFLKYGKKKGIPVVTSYHTDFISYLKYYHAGFLSKPLVRYLRWFYSSCNRTLSPTEEIRSKLNGMGIHNVRIWGRGIHTDIYSPEKRSEELRKRWGAEDSLVILYSGRFVWYKDLDVYMGVYRKFKEDGFRNVKFVLAGDGPIKQDLKKAMPDAIFPGYLGKEELSRVYASSDIFLFPSTTETFGNVVQEAIASGLPSVVSDVGGCQEIVRKSKAGFVAGAKDPDDFYCKCRSLIEDKELLNEYRKNGLEFASMNSWKSVNEKVIDMYDDVLKNR